MYGFNLTTADNLIVMNGDTYALMIEPGYGRQGLAFLRGSVKSYGYFLGKCPFREQLTRYDYDEAMDLLKGYVADGYLTQEELDDCYGLDEGDFWGEKAYYELIQGKVDEPSSPKTLTHTTLNQIAGLMCFVEAYDKLCVQEEEDGKED